MKMRNGRNNKEEATRFPVSGIDISWNLKKGTCTFQKLPVAMMWIDTTLAGLMSGVQALVGTERFLLALQGEGRKSVEGDWQVISKFPNFPEGFKAIANIAAVTGWGEWKLVSLNEEKRECRFRITDSWEGRYQRAIGANWGSGMLAGKMAGYCTKLFGTNCWAEQTAFIARGDAFDEFVVRPSSRDIETEINNLISSDNVTRADMAVALRRLEKEISEREKADKYIAHLGTFPQLNPNPVMEMDLSGRIIFYNTATLEILANLGAAGNIEVFLPKDMAFILQEAKRTGKNRFQREVIIANSCFEEQICVLEGLNVARIYAWDITERKRAEEALRKSEEEMESIFRAAPIGIGLVINRVIKAANNQLCKMVGYLLEEMIGQNARMLYLTEEEYTYVGKEKYRQIDAKGTGTVETLWRRKDGTVINVLLSSTPMDKQDPRKGVTFTALDITERKEAEDALRESETGFRSLFDNMTEGVALHEIIYDDRHTAVDYRVLAVNPAYSVQTGLQPGQVQGKLASMAYGQGEAPFLEAYTRVAETGQSISFEVFFEPLERHFHISATSPKPGRFVTVFEDITKWKMAEEKLRRAQEELEQRVQERTADLESAYESIKKSEEDLRFLTARLLTAQEMERKRVSYELHDNVGQSLTVLKMQLRVVGQHLAEENKAKEELKLALNYLNHLVETVRHISKGLSPALLEDLGLKKALSHLFEETCRRQDIKYALHMDNIDGRLSPEAQINLYRIFQEILNNVVKHAQADRVELNVREMEQSINFCVSDNGAGFDVEETLASRGKDQGLGLTSLEERARMIGGSFTIESKKGTGTTININVPFSGGKLYR